MTLKDTLEIIVFLKTKPKTNNSAFNMEGMSWDMSYFRTNKNGIS